MFLNYKDIDEEDFERIPKKHKRNRRNGNYILGAATDRIRSLFLEINKQKEENDNHYRHVPINDIITYSHIMHLVGAEALKSIKVLLDEGFVEKIKYPHDRIAKISVDGVLTTIKFENGKWMIPFEHVMYCHSSVRIHKAIKKYYELNWQGDRYLQHSDISKKIKQRLSRDLNRIYKDIKWDETGYCLNKGEAFKLHGVRLGFLESPKLGECPHCGKKLPFKGRHGIYSRGHDFQECHGSIVKKVFNE